MPRAYCTFSLMCSFQSIALRLSVSVYNFQYVALQLGRWRLGHWDARDDC